MAETATKGGMGLSRKLGPIPIWAWGILGGIAVYFLYVRSKGSSSATATGFDPNAIDPTTGIPYGQELAGGFPASGGLQGAAGGSTDTSSGVLPTDALDTQLASFLQAMQDFATVANAMGWQPPNTSNGTNAAAGSPPLQNTSPPTPHPAQVSSVAAANKPLLAPGVAVAPGFKLTPPKGSPTAARWAGPHPPGPNWVGIGGGWWAPKTSVSPTKNKNRNPSGSAKTK